MNLDDFLEKSHESRKIKLFIDMLSRSYSVANAPAGIADALCTNSITLPKKTAAAILKIDPINVTKEQRQMAKAVNFGLLFGMGAEGLSRYAQTSYGVSMSLKDAKLAKRAFLNTYSGLNSWQKRTGRVSKVLQKVSTPMGRIRDFRKESRGYRYTEALNTPVQGGAAEIMLCALVRLEKCLDWKQARIVNVVHDEVVVECYKNTSEEVETIIRQQMLLGFLDVFPDAKKFTTGLVDCNVSYNWGDAK